MMARVFLILLVAMTFAFEAKAGFSDPNTVVEDSHLAIDRQGAESSTLKKVTTKVKNLWDSAKQAFSSDDKKVAKKPNTAPKANSAKTEAVVKTQPTVSDKKVNELAGSMPAYQTQKGISNKDLEKAKSSLAPGLTRVLDAGRPAQAGIPKNKVGVPQFAMFDETKKKDKAGKLKTVRIPKKVIPRIDVGQEPKISKNDFTLPKVNFPLAALEDPKPLKSPNMVPGPDISRYTARKFVAAVPVKNFESLSRGIDRVVTKETVNKIVWKTLPEQKIALKEYRPLSEPEQKMLAALILYQKGGQCHFVIGLFDQISQGTKLESEAKYHLGSCAHKMKLYSSSFAVLSKLIGDKNPDYTSDSLEILAADLPEQFETAFYYMVKGLHDPSAKTNKWINEKIASQVYYLSAKGAFKSGNYKDAKDMANRVAESAPHFPKAQYIVGISEYSLGHKKVAVAKLEGLRAWLAEKNITDKNLNSLTALNLARIKFNTAKYKDAFDLYMKVDKEHPTWVQALIEQGWTQLSMEDYSGAIGNMYSLHSPYFTAVYKPESFVVRSIGYLNICQYGDAYKTLSYLEKDYRQWYSDANKYVEKKKQAVDYHQTVVSYLKGKSDQSVDGLPFQVVREMARQKFFLNKQVSLNETLDEMSRHNGLNEKIKEEKAKIRWKLQKSQERLAQVEKAIKKATKEKAIAKDINTFQANYRNERDFVIGYKYQLAMLELSRQGFLAFREKSEGRISKEQYVLRETAGKFLVNYLAKMQKDMGHILDNNEFLRYEVFSGAGESIRYQVAGGQVSGEANRVPASMKPQKMMNWDFDGEYWEDEIGSYRSSLQNLCPAHGKAQSNKDKENDQASNSEEYAR